MEYTVNDTHVTVEHGLGFEGYLSVSFATENNWKCLYCLVIIFCTSVISYCATFLSYASWGGPYMYWRIHTFP